jgi:hypothetical protein
MGCKAPPLLCLTFFVPLIVDEYPPSRKISKKTKKVCPLFSWNFSRDHLHLSR